MGRRLGSKNKKKDSVIEIVADSSIRGSGRGGRGRGGRGGGGRGGFKSTTNTRGALTNDTDSEDESDADSEAESEARNESDEETIHQPPQVENSRLNKNIDFPPKDPTAFVQDLVDKSPFLKETKDITILLIAIHSGCVIPREILFYYLFRSMVLKNAKISFESHIIGIFQRDVNYKILQLINVSIEDGESVISDMEKYFVNYFHKIFFDVSSALTVTLDSKVGLSLTTKRSIGFTGLCEEIGGNFWEIPKKYEKLFENHSSILKTPKALVVISGLIQIVNHCCGVDIGFQLTSSEKFGQITLKGDKKVKYVSGEEVICNYGNEYKFVPCYCKNCQL